MSEIPFELKFERPQGGIDFCGIQIPKYGSLTPNESIALGEIDYEDIPIWEYYAKICNVLLRSRVKDLREYQIKEFADCPMAELEKLKDFALSEHRQWKEPEEESTTEEGESRTGETYTGGSDSDTPTNSDLVENALAIAQS